MRLVATVNIDDTWYADRTVPFMRDYAQRVNADFLEFRNFPQRSQFGSWLGWFKVEAIRHFAEQSYYDQLLLLDADVLVLPHCRDVFELLDGQIAVVADMAMPTVDERFRGWCDRHFGESPAGGSYFNTGVMLVPHDAALRVLEHLDGPYPDESFYDQDFLNLRIPQHEKLHWLPKQFNWLAPQFKEASLKQQIIHFAGDWKKLLPWYVEQLALPRRGPS
jgi:lipopolysaccharide biosynthesis glycosyltransferase